MKNVLVVDALANFKEFIKDKLAEEKITVTAVADKRDSILKMSNLLPDLAIFDLSEYDNPEYFEDILRDIKADPNASRIPLIAAGPATSRENLARYVKYGIRKYFVKPIKFDIFFDSIGKILHTPIAMDTTPCVLDIHRNESIIFVEIAIGLNREKLSLLRYKLSEIIDRNKIETPKVVLMLTNLELTFTDGLNLELLFDNVLSDARIRAKNVKVLSLSSFVQELIEGHPQYDGIETVSDISAVLNSLVESTSSARVADLVSEKILTNSDIGENGTVETRFSTDAEVPPEINIPKAPTAPENAQTGTSSDAAKNKIAIVDNDALFAAALSQAFATTGFTCDIYANGTDFLIKAGAVKYQAVVMEILIPGLSGLDTLKRLQGMPQKPQILICSKAMQKEVVVQALSLGARQYLTKPQNPATVVSKVQDLIYGGR